MKERIKRLLEKYPALYSLVAKGYARFRYLEESCIEILISWPKPMHHHDALGLNRFHLPKTERISNEVLSLPMYPELSEVGVEFVVDAIRKFYERPKVRDEIK